MLAVVRYLYGLKGAISTALIVTQRTKLAGIASAW